jgi:hypothetical protein
MTLTLSLWLTGFEILAQQLCFRTDSIVMADVLFHDDVTIRIDTNVDFGSKIQVYYHKADTAFTYIILRISPPTKKCMGYYVYGTGSRDYKTYFYLCGYDNAPGVRYICQCDDLKDGESCTFFYRTNKTSEWGLVCSPPKPKARRK